MFPKCNLFFSGELSSWKIRIWCETGNLLEVIFSQTFFTDFTGFVWQWLCLSPGPVPGTACRQANAPLLSIWLCVFSSVQCPGWSLGLHATYRPPVAATANQLSHPISECSQTCCRHNNWRLFFSLPPQRFLWLEGLLRTALTAGQLKPKEVWICVPWQTFQCWWCYY